MSEKTIYYKRRLRSLFALYCNYWIILIIFTVISVLIGKRNFMPGSFSEFIGNFLTVRITYNGTWWYLFTYTIIVIISPVLLKCLKRCKTFIVLGGCLLVYLIAYYIRFVVIPENWILVQFGLLGMTVFEYMIGAAFQKEKLFSKLAVKCEKIDKWIIRWILLTVFIMLLLGHTLFIGNVIVAPFTGVCLLIIFKLWKKSSGMEKFFLWIGNNSTNIWLIHMFLLSEPFNNFIYCAKYPILIWGLMIIMTTMISIVINRIYHPIKNIIVAR